MSSTPPWPCTTPALLWQNSLSWTSTPSATCFSTLQGYCPATVSAITSSLIDGGSAYPS